MKDLSLLYPKPRKTPISVESYGNAKRAVSKYLKTGIPMEEYSYYLNDLHDYVWIYPKSPYQKFGVELSVKRFVDHEITNCQSLVYDKDLIIKKTVVNGLDGGNSYSSLQIQDKVSGRYSIARMKEGKVIGGYEVAPVERKLMTGVKGRVEALAMKIGTKSNGCERPVLRRVSGFMLDMLRKIK